MTEEAGRSGRGIVRAPGPWFGPALSCPSLLNRAYRGDSLWEQLDRRTVAFLNDSTFNPIVPPNPGISQLFQWYQADFEGLVRDTVSATLLSTRGSGTHIDFMASYLTDSARVAALRAGANTFVPYDWTVNKQ